MKSRKHRNQRLSSDRERRRQYFVDGVVKRGSSPAGIAIRKWSGRIFLLVLVAALVTAAGWAGARGWKKYVWRSPDYSLRNVQYTTDGSLTREQALQTIAIQSGDNIFKFDTTRAGEALAKLPQVESAEVRKYLPDRLEIAVRERKAVAWVSAKEKDGERSYLLDSRGLVFQPRHILPASKTLPVISGVELGDLEPGRRIRKAEVDAALELLRCSPTAGLFKIASIDVSKAWCIVVADQRGARLTFGLDDLPAQLERLAVVQREAALIGQELATVNLMPARNIPVTFMPPAPPEDEEDEEETRLAPAPQTKAIPATARATAQGTSRATATAASRPASGSRTRNASPTPASRKPEPPRPKEEPHREPVGLLKKFRTA